MWSKDLFLMPCIFVCQLIHLPLLILNQQKKFPKRCNSVSETFFVSSGRIIFRNVLSCAFA